MFSILSYFILSLIIYKSLLLNPAYLLQGKYDVHIVHEKGDDDCYFDGSVKPQILQKKNLKMLHSRI